MLNRDSVPDVRTDAALESRTEPTMTARERASPSRMSTTHQPLQARAENNPVRPPARMRRSPSSSISSLHIRSRSSRDSPSDPSVTCSSYRRRRGSEIGTGAQRLTSRSNTSFSTRGRSISPGSPSAPGTRTGSTPTSTFRDALSVRCAVSPRTSLSRRGVESGLLRRTSRRWPSGACATGPSSLGGEASGARGQRGRDGSPNHG